MTGRNVLISRKTEKGTEDQWGFFVSGAYAEMTKMCGIYEVIFRLEYMVCGEVRLEQVRPIFEAAKDELLSNPEKYKEYQEPYLLNPDHNAYLYILRFVEGVCFFASLDNSLTYKVE